MKYILAGAILCGLGVFLGAFGAHALNGRIDSVGLSIFETGVRYQMYHGLALLILGLIGESKRFDLSSACFIMLIGVCIFSVSLYIIVLTKLKWLGMITPIGGLLMLVGWLKVALQIKKRAL